MTSSWHSISGYLQYKPGGALGRLKVRRRYWFLLDDSRCHLLCYRNQNEAAQNKQPISDLDLQAATFTLSLSDSNQFSITCVGKEHIYTADNHESMMIWLIGLQAKRDAYSAENAAKLEKALTSTDKTLSARDLEFKDGRVHLKTSSAAEQQRRRRLQQQLSESNDGTADLFPVSQWEEEDGIGNTDAKTLSRSLDGLKSSNHYQHVAMGEPGGPDTSEPHAPSEEVFHDDPPPAAASRWRHIRKAISDITDSKVAALYSSNKERNGSLSGTSASSDSALDRSIESDLSLRVSDMEQELIAAKCELAEMKNRETCYKAVLERRDAIIVKMDEQLDELKNANWDKKTADRKLREQLRILQNQNHFLNEEIRKLGGLRTQEQSSQNALYSQLEEMRSDLLTWRHDYLYLLQSSVRIPTGDLADGLEMRLYGGNRHKERIQGLLDDARKINPSLPTFEKLTYSGVHVDTYGFKHQYQNEGMLLHYLCQQLHHFYLTQLSSYKDHHNQWREVLTKAKNAVVFTKELKVLVRRGIPPQYRRDMWRHLVYHHVSDVISEKGACYYSNLCRNAHDSEVAAHYRKQISLDLLRTMPSNVNFCHAHAQLTQKLQEVLLAFCLHNPAVGYCQGMNFITAMGLLFMEPEDAFWLLVAVTEKYFTPSYFDAHLSGAQADQQVLKDIMKVKLHDLHTYMDELDIDISTVTLNWFLAIFFDAVPFETLLRLWDCFLLEGPKVLFRFALAILKLNEATLAEKTDTIGVMRHLKASAGLLFDVDGLLKVAFEDLRPFPRRRDIVTKQTTYLTALKEKLKKKAQQRRIFDETEQLFRSMDETGDQTSAQVFECAATCDKGLVWLCYGDQQLGRMSLVDVDEALMFDLDLELDSRITCMCSIGGLLVLGTLSGQLTCYNTQQRSSLWTVGVHDTVLDLCCHLETDGENKVFAALADGTVGVLENVGETEPIDDPFYIPVGRGPVTSLTLIDSQLWCACGNRVHILHAENLDTMDRFLVSQNPLEHILTAQAWRCGVRTQGLWVTVKGSSVIELWDPQDMTCKMLFDVRQNKHIPVRKEDDGPLNSHRITTILSVEDSLWVGTGEGVLFIYDVISTSAGNQSDSSISDSPYNSRRDIHDGRIPTLKKCKTLDRIKTRSKKKKDKDADKSGETDILVKPQSGEGKNEDGKDSGNQEKGSDLNENTQDRLHVDQNKKMKSSKVRHVSDSFVAGKDAETDAAFANLLSRAARIPKLQKQRRGSSEISLCIKPDSSDEKQYDDEYEVLDITHNGEVRSSNDDLCKFVTNLVSSDRVDGQASESNEGNCNGILTEGREKESQDSDINSNHKPEIPTIHITKNGYFEQVFQDQSESFTNVSQNVLKSVNVLKSEVDRVSGETPYSKEILSEMMKKVQERHALPPVESSVLGEISVFPPKADLTLGDLDLSDNEGETFQIPHTLNLDSADGRMLQLAGLSPIIERAEKSLGDLSGSNQSLNAVVPSIEVTKSEDNPEPATYVSTDDKLSSSGGTEQDSSENRSGNDQKLNDSNVSSMGNLNATPCDTELSIQEKGGKSNKKSKRRTSFQDLDGAVSVMTFCPNESPNNLLNADSDTKVSKSHKFKEVKESEVDGSRSNDQHKSKTKRKSHKETKEEIPRMSGKAKSASDGNITENLESPKHKTKRERHKSEGAKVLPTFQLSLEAKIKISDKAIRCLYLISSMEKPIIISCSGCHGDDEAVLKWRKEPDEKLWTNEPVFEVCPETNRPVTPLYLRKFSSQASTESLRQVTHLSRRGSFKSTP